MRKIKPSEVKKIKHGGFNSLIRKALEMGIKVHLFPDEPSLIKLEYQKEPVFCKRGIIPVKKHMSVFTRDKHLTKTILNNLGIKTPKGFKTTSHQSALSLMKKHKLSYPMIVKPVDGSLARGMTWDIKSHKELKKAVEFFKKNKTKHRQPFFLAEKMYLGNEYRILVFDGKVISCVHKIPASVMGDGKLTIKDLIKKFNKKRLKGFKIKIDSAVEQTLTKNKLSLKSILPKGKNLKLRYNLNMSDGGRAVDCTGKMSQYFKDICEKALKPCGITYGGIDLITKDSSSKKGNYVILEINPNPFYNMHEKPLIEGKGVDVSKKILKSLFSSLKNK